MPVAGSQEARHGMDVHAGPGLCLRAFPWRDREASNQDEMEPGGGGNDAPLQPGLRCESTEPVEAAGLHAAAADGVPQEARAGPAVAVRQAGGDSFGQPEAHFGLTPDQVADGFAGRAFGDGCRFLQVNDAAAGLAATDVHAVLLSENLLRAQHDERVTEGIEDVFVLILDDEI